MTHPSKVKGDRAERELVAQLVDLGIPVRRALGAGRLLDEGDLEGLCPWIGQAKNFASVAEGIRQGLAGAAVQAANATTRLQRPHYPVAFVRRPGAHWVACMDLPTFAFAWRETTS